MIVCPPEPGQYVDTIRVTSGQLTFEWEHLVGKVRVRSPQWGDTMQAISLRPHPLFVVVEGPKENWERG